MRKHMQILDMMIVPIKDYDGLVAAPAALKKEIERRTAHLKETAEGNDELMRQIDELKKKNSGLEEFGEDSVKELKKEKARADSLQENIKDLRKELKELKKKAS